MPVKAVIFAGGAMGDYAFYAPYIGKDDMIICADSGLRHAHNMRLTPHVTLGDFDSLEGARPERSIVHPAEKDKTDTHLAVEYALDRHFKQILILGAIGTRMDHTLANINVLRLICERGASGMMLDEHNKLWVFRDTMAFDEPDGAIISLIPLTDRVDGITTRGLKYPLMNASLTQGESRGVSNIVVGQGASVTIKSGVMLAAAVRD